MVTLVGTLRRFGPIGRRLAWNIEFRNGAQFSGARSPVLLELLQTHLRDKRVVELACGDGSLAEAVRDYGWASYLGFDISSVAIATATQRQIPGVRFALGDMENWNPSGPFDLLLIEEAIYYLVPEKQIELLERAFAAMGPAGLAIVVLHSARKHGAIIDRLGQRYPVVTDRREGDRCYLILGRRA